VIDRDRELTRCRRACWRRVAHTPTVGRAVLSGFDGWVLFDADGTVMAAEPDEYERGTEVGFKKRVLSYLTLRPSEPVYSDVVANTPTGGRDLVSSSLHLARHEPARE